MSDLKVTDVQKAIRSFADNGHDITQSPHQVHLDGKPYGMVVGHVLHASSPAPSGVNAARLESYVIQTEKPLVSKIKSHQTAPKGEIHMQNYLHHPTREVTALVRNQHNHNFGSYGYTNHRYEDLHARDLGRAGQWLGYHAEWQDDHKMWHPHAVSDYTDSHAALQSHSSPSIPHQGFTNNMRHYFMSSDEIMTPKDHSSFNEHEALSHLTGVKPFSGLMTVLHGTNKLHIYTYNPSTEELHEHMWIPNDN